MIYLLVVDEEVRSIPLRGSRLSVDTNYLSPFSSKRRVCQRPIDTLVLVNRQISSEAKEVYYNQKIFTATPTCYEPATHLRMISSVLIRNCSPLGLRLPKNVARRSAVQMLWRTDAHLVKKVELTMDLRSPLPYRPQHPTQAMSCPQYDSNSRVFLFFIRYSLPRYRMLERALHGSLESLKIKVTRERRADTPPIPCGCLRCEGCIAAGRVLKDMVPHLVRGIIIDFSNVEVELLVNGEPAQSWSIVQQSPRIDQSEKDTWKRCEVRWMMTNRPNHQLRRTIIQ